MIYTLMFALGTILASAVWYFVIRAMDNQILNLQGILQETIMQARKSSERHEERIIRMRQEGFTAGGSTKPPPTQHPMIPTDIEQFLAKLEPGIAQVTRGLVYERLEEGQPPEHILNELENSTVDMGDLIYG
jgi:hypothetical protein